MNERPAYTQPPIRDNAQRLLGIINDLLDASKLEAGSMLVALHGGGVWASSPGPNRGTMIHIRLPLAAPAAAGPPAEERAATGTAASLPQPSIGEIRPA